MSESVLDVLSRAPAFAGAAESTLAALAQAARPEALARGATFFTQGDPGDVCYVVQSGRIAIVLLSPDGRELTVETLGPGEVFGELGVLTGRARAAGAQAVTPTTLVALPGAALRAALDVDPRLTRSLLQTVALRLSETTDRQAQLAFQSAEARLAAALLHLDAQAGDLGYVTVSHEALARRAGLTRQTVTKELSKWRRRGYVITGRGHIMLLRPDALAAIG